MQACGNRFFLLSRKETALPQRWALRSVPEVNETAAARGARGQVTAGLL